MKFNPRVLQVIEQEGITVPELEAMVKRAAITSVEGGNRRFHTWLFDVKDFEVLSMRTLEKPLYGEDAGLGIREYDCPMCDGWGCQECGWWGKSRRYVAEAFKVTFPSTNPRLRAANEGHEQDFNRRSR